MKRFILIYAGLSVLLLSGLQANPLIAHYLSELLLDQEDSYAWRLEMTQQWTLEDGQYLTSLSGQGVITGYTVVGNFAVITNDNLESQLSINPDGDILQLHDPTGAVMDEIRFGRVEQPYILAPIKEMSISLHDEVVNETQTYFRYFDASPTIGESNDGINGTGALNGLVYDETGIPLAGVEVLAYFIAQGQYFSEVEDVTAEDGSFIFESYARLDSLRFFKDGYEEEIRRQQIWPDSTVELETVFMKKLSAIEKNLSSDLPLREYRLYTNYPNPFNASTVIGYYLPYSDLVEVTIYDVQGKKIETLYSGYQEHGQHLLSWNAAYLSSGIYIYQLQTSSAVLQKKCLLIK